MTRARRRVLFLCTHNSARSQMAEGLLRASGGERFEAHSAGTEPGGVRPEAVTVMAEVGIDISGQRSTALAEYVGDPFEHVITLCDEAREACPLFPGATRMDHWGFPDPSAAAAGRERLTAFREVRDGLRKQIEAFVAEWGSQPPM
jgi:arsenate reductase (thioredoxin)